MKFQHITVFAVAWLASIPGTILAQLPTSTYIPASPRCANLVVPNTPLYVNQVFPLVATIYVEGYHSIHDVVEGSLSHDSFVIKRFSHIESEGMESGGKTYSIRRLPVTIFALKAGDHKLGPARFDVKLYEKNPRFSGPIFVPPKVHTINSETIRVNILPLPPGAPASFSGGVGSFNLETSASPLKLNTGDPITMQFAITGVGNFETLGPLRMLAPGSDAWKLYEPKKDLEKESDGVNPGKTVFTQVLIPLKVLGEIPAFELSFFDPVKQQYIKQQTAPIKIDVQSDPGFSQDPLHQSITPSIHSPNQSAGPPKIPQAQFPDILHIRKTMPEWIDYPTGKPGLAFILFNSVAACLFIGLLAQGILGKIRARREKLNPVVKTTFKEALHRARPGMDREDFYHAVHEAFTSWEEDNPEASKEIIALVRAMKSQCETKLYSQLSDHDEKPITTVEANEFLKVLKKLPV